MKDFTTMAPLMSVFLVAAKQLEVGFVAIVAWENGDDGKCSPQWNDLGHFAELN